MSDATPTSVYRYYDRHGILIYVCITSRGIERNRQHNATKEWWPHVARQEVEHFSSRTAAASREKSLIQAHFPPFNTQHNPDHKHVRSAYLYFLIQQSDPTPLPELIAALPEKRILLDQHHDGRRLVLRTRPEDAGIAGALQLPSSDFVRVYGLRKPSQVHKIQKVGPYALIHVSRDSKPLLGAHAVVKCAKEAPDRIAHLRVVQVRIDHEAVKVGA